MRALASTPPSRAAGHEGRNWSAGGPGGVTGEKTYDPSGLRLPRVGKCSSTWAGFRQTRCPKENEESPFRALASADLARTGPRCKHFEAQHLYLLVGSVMELELITGRGGGWGLGLELKLKRTSFDENLDTRELVSPQGLGYPQVTQRFFSSLS